MKSLNRSLLLLLLLLFSSACRPLPSGSFLGTPTIPPENDQSTPSAAPELRSSPTFTSTDLPVGSRPTMENPATTSAGSGERRGKIVYTCQPESFRQLCLVHADGSQIERLTDQPAHDHQASLSDDGLRLVFISDLDGYPEMYLRNLKSGEERRLTDRIGQVGFPKISPDGGRVAFSLRKTGGDWSIWTMLAHDSLARPLGVFPGQAFAPAWSPDGSWLAFTGSDSGFDDLFLVSFDGGELRQLTQGDWEIDGGPAWSPDGERLVFSAGRRNARDLYLLAVRSGEVQRLTHGGNNSGPDFSPDGGWIVFSSSRDGDHEIYVMRLDGSQTTQLTDNNFDDWQPNWGQ